MTLAEKWLADLFNAPLNGNPIKASAVMKAAKNANRRFARADIQAAKKALGIKPKTIDGEVYWLDPSKPERKGFGS